MYESFYGLHRKPFQLSPDPEMLYVSYGHKNALSYMEYGLLQGEGFVVLTGDIGAGKTTLIRSLLSQINEDNSIVAASIMASNLDSQEMLAMIAHAFGINIDTASKVVLIKQIKNLLANYVAQKRRVLLIVDEAQTLTPESLEELRILSNTEISGKAAIQIFLVGQEELKTTLLTTEFEHLRQRIIASCHLASLDQDETRNYIQHRLQKSGWNNNPSIDEEVYTRIYEWSGGVPRRINFICDRMLLYGFSSEISALKAVDIDHVVKELDLELAGNEANESAESNSIQARVQEQVTQQTLGSREVIDKLSEIQGLLGEILESQKLQNQLMAEVLKKQDD